jgi:hypothetical protein
MSLVAPQAHVQAVRIPQGKSHKIPSLGPDHPMVFL